MKLNDAAIIFNYVVQLQYVSKWNYKLCTLSSIYKFTNVQVS